MIMVLVLLVVVLVVVVALVLGYYVECRRHRASDGSCNDRDRIHSYRSNMR